MWRVPLRCRREEGSVAAGDLLCPAIQHSCWLAAGLDDVQTWLSQSNKFSGNQDVPKPLVSLVDACVLEKWAGDQSQAPKNRAAPSGLSMLEICSPCFQASFISTKCKGARQDVVLKAALLLLLLRKKPKISNSHSQGSRKNANGKDKRQGDEPVGNLQAYGQKNLVGVPQGIRARMLSFAARPGLNEQEEAYLRQIENSSQSNSRRDGPRTATDDEMQDQDKGGSKGEGNSDVTMEDDKAGYVVVEDATEQKGKKKNRDGESAGRGKVLESDIASSTLAKISKQASRMGICLLDMFPDDKMFAWEILEKELVRQKENGDDAVLEDLIETQKDPQKVEDLLAWMKYGESDVCYALAQAARILVNQYFELGSVAEGEPREKKITGQPFYSLLIPQTLCAFLLDDRQSKADLLLVAELHELKHVPACLIAMVTATVFVLIKCNIPISSKNLTEHYSSIVASLEGIRTHSPAYFDFLEKQAYKNMKRRRRGGCKEERCKEEGAEEGSKGSKEEGCGGEEASKDAEESGRGGEGGREEKREEKQDVEQKKKAEKGGPLDPCRWRGFIVDSPCLSNSQQDPPNPRKSPKPASIPIIRDYGVQGTKPSLYGPARRMMHVSNR
ncbi:hypothetical protein BDP27DRAFT_1376892 [Rhodocollybia butyracea]|uniref:Uncharacterized protein n=1 Tax=Rhodocollybia butyracea TaxID=206335 RepID=A0A9P5P197_9AGAR|nr:hypothetical protein BDP27DRAFT_1376892 [Rhodocollybia butyracea]